jgi:2-keto-4-pentenoate hydratase/2-oxohepta-3-ene-1,7-dioic acid hydratase in catechol pathway
VRIANVRGRLCVTTPDGAVDVHDASGGQFSPDPAAVYDRWDELRKWAGAGVVGQAVPFAFAPSDLGSPSPRPRQVFGIGANYADHIAEAGIETPKKPAVFTKFPTCICGPATDIQLSTDRADWEVELVVVLGRLADRVAVGDAWDHVAGLTVGQDISERRVQFQKPIMQLDLGKSFPTFGPMGPELVTIDELDTPDDLPITCRLNGEEMQSSRTSNLIFDVPTLISYISHHVVMLPGDVLFTGTPAGVGSTRDPRRYLAPGDEIDSHIGGLGSMRNRCIAHPD